MNSSIIVALVIGIILVIIFCSIYFNKKNVIKRALKKIPLRSATNLRTNELSKLYGKALHVKDPLIAPYSNRKCVFYQIKIQQKVQNGKSSHWKTLVEEERFQEFFLNVNGDMVIVKPKINPKNYRCFLVKDSTQKSGTFNDPNQKFKSLLKQYNINSETWLGFNKALRYEEGVIEIGEYITVAGIVQWKSLSEPVSFP